MKEILPLGGYNIYLGAIAESMAAFLDGRHYSQVLVLVDDQTEQYCLPLAEPLLPPVRRTVIRIPSGEEHKNIATCSRIWQQMLDAQADRRALAINLGGGVIGDMGGFCASTYKRGIDFLQIPTTLLSQVDASIGGKLGIDFGDVKNSIGVFRDPQAVLIDPVFLKTLPEGEIRSGLAEVIKHALIADAGQWAQLQVLDGVSAVTDWPAVISASLRIKQRIVEADPFEMGLRKALNFGHTVGHAVESLALQGPAPLRHGEAVAIGMICEAFLSRRRLGLAEEQLQAISRFIIRIYGHHTQPADTFEELLRLMGNDKKNEGGQINFSLLPRIGAIEVNCTAGAGEVRESLGYYNALK